MPYSTATTATSNATTSWVQLEERDRDIAVPKNAYPSLKRGQEILNIHSWEFDKLYEHSKSLVRAYHLLHPPTRNTRHGMLAENHESLVLPLEREYPILRRCRQNWGVRWIVRKAKHSVSVRNSFERREGIIREWKDSQRAEAENFRSQRVGRHESGRESPSGKEPKDGKGVLRCQVAVGNGEREESYVDSDGMDIDSAVDTRSQPGSTKGPQPESMLDCVDSLPHQQSTTVVPGASLASYSRAATFWGTHTSSDDNACAALFQESKSWLVAGPDRYEWQARKLGRGRFLVSE